MHKLNEVTAFQDLLVSEIKELMYICDFLQYNDSETIVKQGEVDDHLFGIIEGDVDIRLSGSDKDAITIGQIHKGDIFGEASMFMNAQRTANVIALGNVVIFRISRTSLIRYIDKLPKAGLKIFLFVIFSLLNKLKNTNTELILEKESTVSAHDLERLKNFFPKNLEDMLE
jgi:CRP-like cAMP-binding protein